MAVPSPSPPIRLLGDRALVVEFGRSAELAVNRRVRAFAERLLLDPLPGVTDVVPGYACVTVHYDPLALREAHPGLDVIEALSQQLLARVARSAAEPRRRPRTVEIPVCYGGDHGPDLAELARHCGLDPIEVVRLHTAPEYEVYMLGFVPGFAYLGGLDRRLAMPRRTSPRKRVPSGSVAVGGAQTGVYPLETPGGWNLLGRTPLGLTRLDREEMPGLLQPGDRVRFVAIDAGAFGRLEATAS